MGEALLLHRGRSRLPKFTYTGNYKVVDEGHGDWRVRFLSSGTLTFKSIDGGISHGIDVFLVGGGGNSSSTYFGNSGTGHGGGGYTRTQKNISVTKGIAYTITVGTGGNPSKAFGYTANAGANGTSGISSISDEAWGHGGNGGSGGGASNYGFGGTGGSNGGNGSGGDGGGTGQGTTTREFGEPDQTDAMGRKWYLYAYGGGENNATSSTNHPYRGDVANSGNGGYYGSNSSRLGGYAGKSGIVIIRNHR